MEKKIKLHTTGDIESLSSRYEQAVNSGRRGIEQLLLAPNLFNWFVGICSITLGFVFVLSSPLITNFQTGQFSSWFMPLQLTLVLGGLGLILSEMAKQSGGFWKIIFRVVLSLAFFALALIWWQGGDYDGFFVTLWLASVILLNLVSELSSLRSYLIFYQGLFVGLPLAFFFLPVSSGLRTIVTQLTFDSPYLAGVWLVVIAFYVLLSWWGYYNDKKALSRLIAVASAPLAALALVYASLSDWIMAFLLLITALFAFLLPFWDELRFRQTEARKYVMRMFGVICALFLVTVASIRVVQNILIANAGLVLSDKLTYGKLMVEGIINNTLISERGIAENGLFIKALSARNEADLDDLLSGFFRSNRALVRIVATDSNGKILSAYPLTTGLVGKTIGKVLFESVSDVFDSGQVAVEGRTVAISMPVNSAKNIQVGAIIGYLDLGTISDQLGEIATPMSNQYFVILDSMGNWVVGPEGESSSRKNDPLVVTLSQKGTLKQGYSQDGVLILEAYSKLSAFGWQMDLVQPVDTVLAVNQTAYVVILAVSSLSVLIVGLTILLERQGIKEE